MDPIEKLAASFERFPGIGPRQARRFVQYLLAQTQAARRDLAGQIAELGAKSGQCPRCFRWFVKEAGNERACGVCRDARRDRSLLFVVEKDTDLDQVERSGFRGLYFVLGGVIPLASEEPEKHVRLKELLRRVKEDIDPLKEVILGLSATTEGDHTRLMVQERLLPLSLKRGFTISSLGRGLSTGSELEYADPDTIASAYNSRA